MITNGGKHPPEFWGQVTAEHIVSVGESATGARRIAALEMQARVQRTLTEHHALVGENEASNLDNSAGASLMDACDLTDRVDAAVKDVQAAVMGTEWEPQFFDPEFVDQMRAEIASHFAANALVERSHWADNNPATQHAAAFRAMHHPEG